MQKYQQIQSLGKCLQDNSILYLSKEKDTQKYFMIKKITLFTSDKSEQLILCEAKILKQLNHPHILKYYDILLDKNDLIQVLQFCQYGSILNYLQKRKQRNETLSQKLIISWVMQILMALQYLNQKHIVHRLLTTDNIYMNHQGDLKIGSFGKAKQLQNTLQKAQTIVGEPCNLSPQMVQGCQYDSKTDIWSLGCLIYHLVTFQPLFKYGNLLKLYDLIVQQPCSELPLKYSKYLSPLYKKMMRKNPLQRPSASQLLQQEVFCQLMKQYLKKKKIDSIDLKKMEPKPLIVQKKINEQRKSNKIRLQPLISSSRVSVKSPLSRQKQVQNEKQKRSARMKTNEYGYDNEFDESIINGKILPPVVKNKSGQLNNPNKLGVSLNNNNNKANLMKNEDNNNRKKKQKSIINTPIKQCRQQIDRFRQGTITKESNSNTKQQKNNCNTKQKNNSNNKQKIQQKQQQNIYNNSNDSDKKQSVNNNQDMLGQKCKQREYIQLLYRVKLQYLQQKYSPNMSKILQQTTQFESFKDLLLNQ